MISEAKLGILRTLRDSVGPVSFAGLVPEEGMLRGMMFNGLIDTANKRFDDSSDRWRITKAGLAVLQREENRLKYPPRPTLGQKVRINGYLYKNARKYLSPSSLEYNRQWYKNWSDASIIRQIGYRKVDWERLVYDTPKEGIFIGVRTVQNGHWETDGDEDGGGSYFFVSEYIDAWLIVTHIQRNPFYVSPLDVEVV